MNKHTIGLGFLTLWTGFNLLLALGIVVAVGVFSLLPPAVPLMLTEAVAAELTPDVSALFRTMGVLLNACLGAVSLTGLVLTWWGIRYRIRWTWWTVALSLGLVQACGVLSDRFMGHTLCRTSSPRPFCCSALR